MNVALCMQILKWQWQKLTLGINLATLLFEVLVHNGSLVSSAEAHH